jgi:hypothetical protein
MHRRELTRHKSLKINGKFVVQTVARFGYPGGIVYTVGIRFAVKAILFVRPDQTA